MRENMILGAIALFFGVLAGVALKQVIMTIFLSPVQPGLPHSDGRFPLVPSDDGRLLRSLLSPGTEA